MPNRSYRTRATDRVQAFDLSGVDRCRLSCRLTHRCKLCGPVLRDTPHYTRDMVLSVSFSDLIYKNTLPRAAHVVQACRNMEAGRKALTTETGAGQWGSALAMACNFFDIALEVYMLKVPHFQKPYRPIIMENFGANVFASPSENTRYGRDIPAEGPDSPGSLGMAISGAVEGAASSGGAKKYSLGSVPNDVLMHQTVIAIEWLQQVEMAGEYPDIVIGCAGGGSNFAGVA
jgi:predicted alternative tryptophan synthase beta-subunit